jgi:hypothetical protein
MEVWRTRASHGLREHPSAVGSGVGAVLCRRNRFGAGMEGREPS